MKGLKIFSTVLLALVLVGIIGYAAYAWGASQNKTTVINNNNGDNTNTSNNSPNITPKVVTEPTCNADELSLAIGEADAAGAGTLALNLVLTNTGSRECTLGGYPGVSLVNANGNQIGNPAERANSDQQATVTLQPNQAVTALVTYPEEGNFDPGTCKDGATKLRVYPPNDYGYLSIASPITGWCPGFQVYAVVAQ